MNRLRCAICLVAGLTATLWLPRREPVVAQDQMAATPVVKRCLAIRVFGRSPSGQVDVVAARIAAGEWAAPAEGDELPLPNGQTVPWQTIDRQDGTFHHQLLRGGYASFLVDSPVEQVVVMRIQGPHRACYVNGRPRVGNVYNHGHVRLPVLLNRGSNELLVHSMSESLGISLEPPGGTAPLNTADTTLPDLIVGRATDALAAVTIINASKTPLAGLQMHVSGDIVETTVSELPVVAPLTVRKVACRITGPAPRQSGTTQVALNVVRPIGDTREMETLSSATVELDVRQPEEPHRRTFLSHIDGSVQYYAVTPAIPVGNARDKPALFLTLHGAAVEAIGQARAYGPKSWGHIVAPTNRDKWGFDWEDWGRLDALEALADAQQQLGTDPRRTYLTGHSMGGHGTWQIGATYPDRFAAIGPSAGWISFSTYGRGSRNRGGDPVSELARRAGSPSDTLILARNHLQHGVYILHGSNDDNVPVDQARRMNQKLSEFHHDLAFHEEPDAGHWWNRSDEPGADCVDWAPMFDMFARRVIPLPESIRDIEFTTANPGISAWCHWCGILAQQRQLHPATVKVRFDPGKRRFVGTTDNVSRLALDLRHVTPAGPLTVTLDGQTISDLPWPDDRKAFLQRVDDKWQVVAPPPGREKGPHRYGTFKDVFRNRMLFVYGTGGDDRENQAIYDKARLDAETFWYRGNGSVELIPDCEFDPSAEPNRNVVLYGNSKTNSAWNALLAECPIRIAPGEIRVGDHTQQGDDLVCLMIRPRAGSERASVGAVAATGAAGMRQSAQIEYFRSRVAYPDWTVFSSAPVMPGYPVEVGAGFFGLDWSVERGESAWR